MNRKILFPIIALCLLLSGCAGNESAEDTTTEAGSASDETILLTVNEEPIYQDELDEIKPTYEENGLTEPEIIEGMVLELITLQQAEELSVSVSMEDVDARFDELAGLEQSLFYEKMIEQYGSESDYKDSLYYKMIYDEVSAKIKESFSDEFQINNELLQERTQDYISQYTEEDFEKNNISEEDFSDKVIQTYEESLLSALKDLYFKVWQYRKLQACELSYENYSGDDLFQVQEYRMTADTLKFKGNSYEMEEVSLTEIQDRFGNYFYLPDSAEDVYGEISGKAVHISTKDVRGFFLTLGTDSPITVEVIVSPVLSLYNNFQQNMVTERTESGLNKIEYFQPDLGIYYSVTAELEYAELETFLESYIPYDLADNTDTTLSRGSFTQEIDLEDGNLIFNDCYLVASDMSYFPDTAWTERWNSEQVTEYLGASFYPSYVPEDLKLFEGYYSDVFISEYTDGDMYWTVAFDENADSPIYDNFGLFYSNSFSDEYDPLRKNLYVEVAKNKIPLSDTEYLYTTSEMSNIGDTELTIGFFNFPYYDGGDEPAGYSEYYIAEFVADDVGYRIRSQNLSQEDFVKVLVSLPVFQ